MKKRRLLVAVMIMLVFCNLFIVNAEAKTYRYATSMVNKSAFRQNQKNGYASSYKAKLSGNKLIIYGTFDKSRISRGEFTRTTRLSNRKRTYTIAKKVKYYVGFKPASKNAFNYAMTRYNGLGLVFITENGKIVQMSMCS